MQKPRGLDLLNNDQRAALLEYARANGSRWRESLSDDWVKSAAGCLLQQVRNAHGPSWLWSAIVKRQVAERLL